MEEWRDIPGWEGRYQVSSHGRVKSVARKICGESRGKKVCRLLPEKIMKLHYVLSFGSIDNPYHVVWLRMEGRVHKKFFVHKLVAIAFIPNPNGHPMVNHKDEVKANCHVSNLEWCTYSENTIYYFKRKKEKAMPEPAVAF